MWLYLALSVALAQVLVLPPHHAPEPLWLKQHKEKLIKDKQQPQDEFAQWLKQRALNSTSIPINGSITIDHKNRMETSPLLYGMFVEEINHAGDGGLNAEFVQDRSFDWQERMAGTFYMQNANASFPYIIESCGETMYVALPEQGQVDLMAMWSTFQAFPARNDRVFPAHPTVEQKNEWASLLDVLSLSSSDTSSSTTTTTTSSPFVNHSSIASSSSSSSSSFAQSRTLNHMDGIMAVSFQMFSQRNYWVRLNTTSGAVVTSLPPVDPSKDPTFDDDASFMIYPSELIKGAFMIASISPGYFYGWVFAMRLVPSNCDLCERAPHFFQPGGYFPAPFPRLVLVPPHVGKRSLEAQWYFGDGIVSLGPIFNAPLAWQPYGPASIPIVNSNPPLNSNNTWALQLTTSAPHAGIINTGYWGMNVIRGKSLTMSLYARIPSKQIFTPYLSIDISLRCFNGTKMLGTTSFANITSNWLNFVAEILPFASCPTASLYITLSNASTVFLDVVSLYPTENVKAGHPFRMDLLDMMISAKPKFLRFPGGSYDTGNLFWNHFDWKTTVLPVAQRPGHLNDWWNYWSTDALGYYEYLILSEILDAAPVWVVFMGNGALQATPTFKIQYWIEDVLDSLQFAMGGVNTTWGAVRAAMGHPEPFMIRHLALGNEVDDHPYYNTNYIAIYEAVKQHYPHIHIICDIDLGSSAPIDLYDVHIYSGADWFFYNQFFFDSYTERNNKVFNSEYAATWGSGNVADAVGEAAWLTGLERNSDLVWLASYAPLFANVNALNWNPNAILINSEKSYGTPSYWTSHLFSHHYGPILLRSTLSTGANEFVASSTTCTDKNCTTLNIKLVNWSSTISAVEVRLINAGKLRIQPKATFWTLTGDPGDENSFEIPELVVPVKSSVVGLSNNAVVMLSPFSVNVLIAELA